MRISESTALSSKSPRAWERMRARWRAGDLALLERAVAQQVHALAARVPERDWLALLELLEALHAAQPLAAFAVAERLEGLMRRLSVEGLRRWVLTGLRLHEGANGQALQRYFALDSGDAVQALHREASLVDVSSLLPSLGWLAHLLAGESMAVQVRPQTVLHAAAQRPVLEPGHGLFLPDGYTALDGADSWKLLRAAVAHAAAHWKHSPRKQPGRGLKPMGHAVVGALEDARAEWLFANELPGVGRWFAQAWPVPAREERRDDFEGLLARLHWALADEAHEDPHAWIVKARTAFSRLRDDGQLKGPNALRQAASVLANDLGQMRLRMNLQTFHVPAAYRDDNSFLWDLGDNANDPPPEIQSDVPVQQTARRPPPQSGEDRDGVEAPLVCASDPLPFFYPEWDYRAERLRSDWCTVYERLPLVGESANAHWREPPSRHGKWRAALRTDRSVRLRRQWQGDELDLDAAIEWQVDRRSSRDPGPRIFRDAGRASPALSLLVLVDLSESCNDLVANTDLRLLDLQKQALRLLAKRLDGSTMRLAIHGFHSDTRKSISYFRMLDFGARLDSGGERALQGLRAAYSTRLGAALRHASGMVAHETNARRVIVVLSDGEPSDIDVHDREYLLEDARHAVHEARRNRVNVASLVVGDTGAASARAIYGAGAYAVARNPAELPARLFGFLERLARM